MGLERRQSSLEVLVLRVSDTTPNGLASQSYPRLSQSISHRRPNNFSYFPEYQDVDVSRVYITYWKKRIFQTVDSRCVSHSSSTPGTAAAARLVSEVSLLQVQPASVCQRQSFIQSPSTVSVAYKNDRREFKNNGDNLQQTPHSKKLRGLFKHLQIFAKGI